MLQAPEKYLNHIISKIEVERDITALLNRLILNYKSNLHFIISEKELAIDILLLNICKEIAPNGGFTFKRGQKVLRISQARYIFKVQNISTEIELISDDKNNTRKSVCNLKNYIPITGFNIQRIGNIQNRIDEYQNLFNAKSQDDFINNEKLLVIGNLSIFKKIPKECPACFVSENGNGESEIIYNSIILPRITVLKSINLLDNYLQHEINGEQVSFCTCIFIGSTKFENSINHIRNYYHQRRINKLIFIGDKDIKIDLGNNHLPLRWKWTIPEINFFKGEKSIQHKQIVINNIELEKAITGFYKIIREIEIKHTISLKPIFRFIRRLYYDWNLKQESTFVKLHQIKQEFDIALKHLLIETLGNIFYDFNFEEYLKPLSAQYDEIINSIKSNNKYEILKNYKTQIHQLVIPSFLCNTIRMELNEIAKQSMHYVKVKSLQDISLLQKSIHQHSSDSSRNFYSLTANGNTTEISSLSKSDDSNEKEHKIISSIYGSGKVEKLIERLGKAKSEYKMLLYSIEEKAWKHHLESYIYDLNKEYTSQDRFQISGVEFNDNYYQFSDYDELIEALASTRHEHKEAECHKITFNDNSKMKLPSTKTVLKIKGSEKNLVLVEDLNVGEKVLVYSNPDKQLLRDIMELMNPELIKKADEYSLLWRTCLIEAYQNNILAEPLYHQLVKNHFSVSEFTFRKYLTGEVMFPRSFSDLVVIAKTINDPRLSFDFLKNTMKPKIEEYRGMEIEYGFKFSNSINNFIILEETDEFISDWLTKKEIENIVSQIPVRTIKDIELITQNSDD